MCDEQTADEYEIDFSAPDGNAYSVCGAVGIFCCWVRRLPPPHVTSSQRRRPSLASSRHTRTAALAVTTAPFSSMVPCRRAQVGLMRYFEHSRRLFFRLSLRCSAALRMRSASAAASSSFNA